MPVRVTPVASYRIAQPAHVAANASTSIVRARASIAVRARESKENAGLIAPLAMLGAKRKSPRF
jgi:hypothetical protein